MEPITSFQEEYKFLSNFYPSTVHIMNGPLSVACPTVEHAFQALKTENVSERTEIIKAVSPGAAKLLGRTCTMRSQWNEIKIQSMKSLLKQKFKIPTLKAQLVATGDRELVEGNHHGDVFWGVCKGKGENHLGLLLMEVRAELGKGV